MKENKPNIVYILADDMGYGDMACNNENSKIPTPNLDRLAAQGMRFTDAHAASSICTPSRYNVLTGRYCWRGRLKRGIVWEWDSPLIEPDRMTVADLLKQQGYATHCIGKWHLGWDWKTKEGDSAGEQLPFGANNPQIQQQRVEMGYKIDYSARIGSGPVDHGFDSYFGIDVPNFQPYTWFEDDHVTDTPTVLKPDTMYGHPGLMEEGWRLEAMIPAFTKRATKLIENVDEPFFLYFPLTSPHAPICPNKEFEGMSDAGRYGDFVCEVDCVVGQVMEALERSGKSDDTLLIFTSDNGPEAMPLDYEGVYELARNTGHYCMGNLRGTKRDIEEGGHREPFIARWPGVTPPGTVCDQVVCLGDLMATCADITGTELPDDAAEDSVSMLPLLKGNTELPTRKHLIHHSGGGTFAIRSRDYVLLDTPKTEMLEPEWFKEERGYVDDQQPGKLYNLQEDLAERRNKYADEPDLVKEMSAILEETKSVARTRDLADNTRFSE